MLWYLLYPVRGTSDPPKLRVENPVRRAFYRHGLTTARHWQLAMLVTVTIGVVLTYPVIFLSDFPTAGLGGLPHHVWESARSFEGRSDVQPNLEMRQIWIHGSYMRAIDKTVLQQAFSLQDAVFEGTSHVQLENDNPNEPNKVNWGFHSPLMYWGNDHQALSADSDILRTINAHTQRTSFLNFTLKPMSVFAGKTFSESKLTAADALVISLFNRYDDPIGRKWHDNILHLPTNASDKWTLYQGSNPLGKGQLYEYRFQPLSFRQNSLLAIAYGCMIAYVAASLRRLKAFRSRFGLIVTAVTQMTTSILASFTICGVLNINLAQIPQEAYPFVVLVIGLENIFRLINAVLAYPPEMLTVHRIANGLGDIGHASLASAGQNLFILWLLSLFVSPGVAAFCAFASIALLFDYFFLITFFVAVLSVDIRRLELQDSLTRSNKRPRRKPSPERHSWVEALLHGKVPFSTRMAGSAVTTTFILALNWHFSDHSHPSSPFKLFSGFTHTQKLPIAEFDGTSPPPMNQTRSPATWLRMQDYDNAVQFMKVVDPTAHGFVAKIFDPLVVVLAGSDRNGIPLERKTWLSALRRLAITHFYPFALAVVFIIAFVTVLMNFLLWDEGAEKAELENGNPDDPRVTVEAVQARHQLDIVKIAGCKNGAFASAGLDRSVSVFSYDSNASKYIEMGVPKDMASRLAWPIHAVAVTEGGQWLALLCDDGHVAIFALPETQLSHRISLGLDGRAPLTFGFLQQPGSSSGNPPLIAVADDGSLTEINVESGLTTTHQTGASALSAAMIMPPGLSAIEVLCATPDNRLCRGRKVAGLWHFSDFFPCSPEPEQNSVYLHRSVIPLPDLHMAAIYNGTDITFLQLASLDMGLSITVEGAKPHSIRVLYADPEKCPGCGAPAVGSLAIVYTDTETQDCVMITHTFSPDATGPICLAQDTEACVKLIHVTRSEYRLAEPGAWEATSAQAIVGIRHAESPAPTPPPSPSLQPQATFRNRKARPTFQHRPESTEEWEAYAFTMTGDFHKAVTKPVEGGDSGTDNELFATKPGPSAVLGPRAVAFAIGNTVHMVKVGADRIETGTRSSLDVPGSTPSRRRLTARKAL